jgi:hypothetical protein
VAIACLVTSSQGCRIGYELMQGVDDDNPIGSAGATFGEGSAGSGGLAGVGTSADGGQSASGAETGGTAPQAGSTAAQGGTTGQGGEATAGAGGSQGPGMPCASRALSLDGSTQGILSGAALPLGNAPRTIELWFKLSAADWMPGNTVFEYGVGGAATSIYKSFAVDMDVFPQMELYHRARGGSLYFDSGASPDTWNHLAVTYDGTQSNVFINGGLAVSRTYPEPLATVGSSFFLGCTPDNSGFFKGAFDELRVWSVARSQAEIQQSMSRQLAGTGYWRLDDEAPTLVDSSPQGNDGIVDGNAVWVDGVSLTCP